MDPPRRELFAAVLPKKLTRLSVETEQTAQVCFGRETGQVSGAVVGADEHFVVDHDRVAVRLAAEVRDPANIQRRRGVPFAAATIKLAGLPLVR
jgi:hypothetical protein